MKRENPRRIEVNRNQPSKSQDQKEKSVPNRKPVIDIKSVQQATLTRQNSVKPTQKEPMLPPAPKKPVIRQERSTVNIEVRKESSTVTSRSSSVVLQQRNSLPNMPNNTKKRKAEEALGRNVELKQVKKNVTQSAEKDNQKIHILPDRNPARLMVERKTMDRGILFYFRK